MAKNYIESHQLPLTPGQPVDQGLNDDQGDHVGHRLDTNHDHDCFNQGCWPVEHSQALGWAQQMRCLSDWKRWSSGGYHQWPYVCVFVDNKGSSCVSYLWSCAYDCVFVCVYNRWSSGGFLWSGWAVNDQSFPVIVSPFSCRRWQLFQAKPKNFHFLSTPLRRNPLGPRSILGPWPFP